MNWDELLVIGRDRNSFKALVGRKIRERRQDERQLAEHSTTKHQLQARNSCVADARSYRVARRLPVPAAAQSHWKALIAVKQFSKIRSVAQEISRLAIRALADSQFCARFSGRRKQIRRHLRNIETRSLPTLTHCFPRNFTFYVAHPIRSIRTRWRVN
jgi:hypothetical protein